MLNHKNQDFRSRSPINYDEDIRHLQQDKKLIADLEQEKENQRYSYDRQLSQVSLQKDEMTSELNRSLRQIDNLNLVVETKEQEIGGWEYRFQALQNNHIKQLENLQFFYQIYNDREHFENLMVQRVERETKSLQFGHDKSKQNSESNHRYQLMRSDENDARNKQLIKERDYLIQQLQARLAELEYILPTQAMENQNLVAELEQLQQNYHNSEQNYKHELLDNQKLSNDMQRTSYDQGFQKGLQNGDGQNRQIQSEYQQLKGRFMEACQRIITHQEESHKLTDIINEYKDEIENWKRRIQEYQQTAADDMMKLRQEYDSQTQEWLDREMFDTKRKFEEEKNDLEYKLKLSLKECAQLEHKNRDLESNLRNLEKTNQQILYLENELQDRDRQIHQKNQEINELNDRKNEDERENNEQLQRSQHQKDQLKKENDRNIKKLMNELDQLNDQLQIIQPQNQDYEQQIKNQQYQQEQYKNQVDFMQQNNQAQNKLQQSEINRLIEEQENQQSEKTLLEAQLKQKTNQVQESQNKLKYSQEQIDQVQIKNIELNNEMENKNQQFQRDIDRLQQERTQMDSTSKQLKTRLQEKENKLQQSESEMHEISNQSQDLIMQQESQITQLKNEKISLENNLKQIKTKLDHLEQQHRIIQQDFQLKSTSYIEMEQNYLKQQKQQQSEKQHHEQQIRDLDGKQKNAKSIIQEFEIKITNYDEDIQIYKNNIEQLENENDAWDKKYQNMEYEYTTQIETLTEISQQFERFQMSDKDWKLRFDAERQGLELQILQLQQHYDDVKMTNSSQIKEIKRLDQVSTERLVEIEKLKQQISNAQHTQREYDEINQRFEDVQNELFDLQQEKLKFNSTKNSLEKQIKRLEEEVKNKEQETEESYALIKKHRDEADQVNREKEQLRKEIHKSQNLVQDRDSTIQLNQEKSLSLQRDNEDLQNQVQILKGQTTRMETDLRQKHTELLDKIKELDLIKAKYQENWDKIQQNQAQNRTSVQRKSVAQSNMNIPNIMESPKESNGNNTIPTGQKANRQQN